MGIRDILKKHKEKLMNLPGVESVGIGKKQGQEIIIIMVSEETSISIIPENINGYTVEIRKTGKFRAFN